MWVYLYPNNTETELKNAYIWIPNPESIVLDKSSISLTTIWQTEQLTATIEPTLSDHSITWSSDDTTVATVSTTGLVTCVTPWSCTITATTVNGLTASCSVAGWRLPSAYQEVEWIENTSTSWIDTWLLNGIWYKIDFKFYTTSNSPSDQTIVGWANTSGDPIYLVINYGQWAFFLWINGIRPRFWSPALNNLYTVSVSIQSNSQEVVINWSTTYSWTDSVSGTSSQNLSVFSRRGSNYAKMQLYYMQIYDITDTLLRDFVPCYRIADDVIWLYDLVNDVFYTNVGGWTFNKWADV